jgi:uncharacterized membrane protein
MDFKKYNQTIWLFCCVGFCVGLSFYRVYYTQKNFFLFLNWNLLLAIVPYLLSSILISNKFLRNSKIAFVIVLLVWILFFPNSPYIFTDLFHIKVRKIIPIWYDLVLILSFAFTGILFGFKSLYHLVKVSSPYINLKIQNISIVFLFFLSSYGIYLGRFLRWNSWDLMNEPFKLLNDIGEHIVNPSENASVWGMTIIMGLFLNMLYWSLKILK